MSKPEARAVGGAEPLEVGAVPLRRTGTLAEVAATVVWLLSDESSYVNGQNVIISGGI